MKKRPALYLLITLLPGMLAADRAPIPPAFSFPAAGAGLALLALAWRGGRVRLSRFALCLLPSLLFLARVSPLPPLAATGETVTLRGRVVMGTCSAARTVRIRALNGFFKGRHLELCLPFEAPIPSPGRIVRVTGRAVPLPSPRNPGAPDLASADRRRGDPALIEADRVLIEPGGSILEPAREALRTYGARLGGREGGLFLALFLADRNGLDREMSAAFRKTGLTHLLALSGLNIGILYCIFSAPLSLLLPRRAIPAVAVVLLWAFGALASMPISLLRALLMATVLAGARLLQRRLDWWNTLAVAALVPILADPGAPWDVSFQLSFAATAGILALGPHLGRLGARWWARFLLAPILVSLAAQAATLPIVLHQFGTFAPFGAIATLVASPFNAAALAAGSAWASLGWLHPGVDATLESATWGSLALFRFVVERSAAWTPPLPSFSRSAADRAALFLLLLPLPLRSLRRRRLRLLSFLPLVLPLVPRPDPLPMRITILDVGQGSAAVAELPGGETLLFDAGPATRSHDAGRSVVLPFLRRRGALPIDVLFVSHPDMDHSGGASAILREETPRGIVDHGLAAADSLDSVVEELAARCGASWSSARRGGRFRFRGGVTLDVLHAGEGSGMETNAASLVLVLRYRRFGAVFPGDAPPAVEKTLAREGAIGAVTLLVAPHHGSKRGCATEWARLLRPSAAVLSVGARNRYGHPDPGVLARLRAVGATVWRTDRHGAVTIRTDGERVEAAGILPGSPVAAFRLPARPHARTPASP